jgi:myosin heavy subunit
LQIGRGSDLDWLKQLRACTQLRTREHFQLPKFQDPSFIVKHFAADVMYRIDGFLEKNKDTVSEQLVDVVKDSNVISRFDLELISHHYFSYLFFVKYSASTIHHRQIR